MSTKMQRTHKSLTLASIHTHKHTYARAHTHAHTRTHAHTHTRTHTHTHAHPHPLILAHRLLPSFQYMAAKRKAMPRVMKKRVPLYEGVRQKVRRKRTSSTLYCTYSGCAYNVGKASGRESGSGVSSLLIVFNISLHNQFNNQPSNQSNLLMDPSNVH